MSDASLDEAPPLPDLPEDGPHPDVLPHIEAAHPDSVPPDQGDAGHAEVVS